MAPGATPKQIEAELAQLNSVMMEEPGNPQWLSNAGYRTVVADAQADLVRGVNAAVVVRRETSPRCGQQARPSPPVVSVAFVQLIGGVNICAFAARSGGVRLSATPVATSTSQMEAPGQLSNGARGPPPRHGPLTRSREPSGDQWGSSK
jgi:hypothetical protein